MSVLLFVPVALAGGIGATARLMLDGIIRTRIRAAIPWATIAINLTGSLLIGLLTGLATGPVVPEPWHAVIGAGFLGGYTTFSAASFETIRLLQDRRWVIGSINGLGTLVCATGAAALGLLLGSLA